MGDQVIKVVLYMHAAFTRDPRLVAAASLAYQNVSIF